MPIHKVVVAPFVILTSPQDIFGRWRGDGITAANTGTQGTGIRAKDDILPPNRNAGGTVNLLRPIESLSAEVVGVGVSVDPLNANIALVFIDGHLARLSDVMGQLGRDILGEILVIHLPVGDIDVLSFIFGIDRFAPILDI